MIVVGALAALMLVLVSAMTVGRVAFGRQVDAEVDRLLEAARRTRPTTITESDLRGLPEPVQRWMRWSQVVGKEQPVIVRLKQGGQFRLEGRGWMPFRAEQYFTTDPPGFVWSVSMRMFPFVSVTGRDKYEDGGGGMRMRVMSLIPVANKDGGGLDQGDLLRYLGETIWFPAGVLSPYIKWEDVDGNAAQATMSYAGITASATFFFDDQGRPTDVTAERYNDARDALKTWSAPITTYGEFDGVRVPVEGAGLWKYETGDFSYIRWRITEVDYNKASRF
jgi:hypothetical protein